jgi:hypothetical protein
VGVVCLYEVRQIDSIELAWHSHVGEHNVYSGGIRKDMYRVGRIFRLQYRNASAAKRLGGNKSHKFFVFSDEHNCGGHGLSDGHTSDRRKHVPTDLGICEANGP